ncbi:MAG: hypothetical protein GQ474_09000 [Sulfurimonas sp.]|nr:hypothetical protein [Sulfurimonas sp.]
MDIEEQELKVKILANERDRLRNKDVKFTAYIFVSILGIVITLGALIMNSLFDVLVPSATTIVFAISAVSLFVLKSTKKNIEMQENIASDEYDNALAQLNAIQEKD